MQIRSPQPNEFFIRMHLQSLSRFDSCVNSISSNSLVFLPIKSPRGNRHSPLFQPTLVCQFSALYNWIHTVCVPLCVWLLSFHILCVRIIHVLFCIAVACSCLNAVSPCFVLKMPLQAFVTTVFFSFIHLKLPKSGTE